MIFENLDALHEYIHVHGYNDNHCEHCGAEIPAGLNVCPVTESQFKEAET